jgi:pimeloyl-ACP methyl ester carboxylesterase
MKCLFQSLWHSSIFPISLAAHYAAVPASLTMRDIRVLSGEASGPDKWRFVFKPTETILDSFRVPEKLPPWLTEEDLEFYTSEFKRTGFVGRLNWYRNIDETWELVGFLEGATLKQPSLFITGDKDPVIVMYADWYKNVDKLLTNLRVNATLPGVGHWTQPERPAEVSRLTIDFRKGLPK